MGVVESELEVSVCLIETKTENEFLQLRSDVGDLGMQLISVGFF